MSSCGPWWTVSASSRAGSSIGPTRSARTVTSVGRNTVMRPAPWVNNALSYRPPGGSVAVDDLEARRIGDEQATGGPDGLGGRRQSLLEVGEVVGDERGTLADVGAEQADDVADGHVQVAEPTDDLRGRDLVGRVVAVARVPVDPLGWQQAGLVIVAQGLDAQGRHGGEPADAQQRRHDD